MNYFFSGTDIEVSNVEESNPCEGMASLKYKLIAPSEALNCTCNKSWIVMHCKILTFKIDTLHIEEGFIFPFYLNNEFLVKWKIKFLVIYINIDI